jgi:hypothetical protein
MPHHPPLISTIVVALVLAFILGAIANRFRVSPPSWVPSRWVRRGMGEHEIAVAMLADVRS